MGVDEDTHYTQSKCWVAVEGGKYGVTPRRAAYLILSLPSLSVVTQ